MTTTPDQLYSGLRARKIAELVGLCNPDTFELHQERRFALAYNHPRYFFRWRGSDGTWHEHEIQSMSVWFNMCEPGHFDPEELDLLRVKVKLTTC